MPIKLIEPGKRKGNRYYLLRGRIGGRTVEISTRTTNKKDAQAFARRFAERAEAVAGPRKKTFKVAATLYEQSKDLSKDQTRYLRKLVLYFGNTLLDDLKPATVLHAAHSLYPRAKPQTKNRQCISVIRAVYNFAVDNEMAVPRKFPMLEEQAVDVDIAYPEDATALIELIDDEQIRAVLTVLIFQGWRITETLSIKRDRINFVAGTIRRFVSKSRKWKTVPLVPEVVTVLEGLPLRRDGRVFRWNDRHNFYRALRPHLARLNVHYTPHMSRRGFATALLEDGVNLKAIQEAGQWEDLKSVARYADVNEETTRATLSVVGERVKTERKKGNAR